MNERIRELMGNTLDEKFAGTWSTMDMQDLTKFSERFAELIVKECIEINKVETTARDLPEYNLGMLEGYRRARENMGIHFGVEE